MVENRIMITVPDNVTIISGAEIGLEANNRDFLFGIFY